ncbi:MAG: tetratricopeptide repeat protein [Bdellovibrionaceae bacterium]|nr:tetratricopeptide repeat protein [Pseudobdellovibrionaceae bacterium]
MTVQKPKSIPKFLLVTVLTALVAAGTSASAQNNRSKSKAKPAARGKAPSQQGVSSQRKTVGELFKSADRGQNVDLGNKGDTSLPTVQKDLFNQKATSNVNLGEVKPPRTRNFYQDGNDDKARLESITDRQINELFKLTQRFKSSPQRGELWLRLAELYVEKAGIIDFRKQDEYDAKLKAFEEGKTKVRPKLDASEAREYNQKAIQLYEWFVRDFPKDPKIDQALFFLGYNYYEVGNTKKGTEYYTRLTENYPRSPYLVESSFALAEFYFENEKWAEAKTFYDKVTRNRKHRLYVFSMYKSAWCLFRGGNAKQALVVMERLIRESKQEAMVAEAGNKKLNKGRLEAEGLRDMVLFYSEVGDAQNAPRYFQSLAGKDAGNYLEKLAYFYADKGNREGARFLFNYLIERNPTSPKAFDYKYQIVQTYSTANRTREFREELYSWVKDFSATTAWGQANKANKDLVDNSNKLREQTLRTWVLQQHQTAQNARTPFAQGLAYEGYRLYLTEFGSAPQAPDMHFYYGELLYDMGRFDDAGARYKWVVDNAPTSKFAAKAGENMVLALEKNVPKDEEIVEKVGKTVDPVPLDPKVEKFVQAGAWYVQKFPNTEKTPEIRFRIARLLYQHNQFDRAEPAFKEIIQKYPKTKYAEYSANLLLDLYNLKKDYAGLEKTGRELLQGPLANSQVGADIRGILEKANFKKAQELEAQKEYGKSADQFDAFARQNPKSDLALTAMFNAAINHERAGATAKAIGAHNAILKSNDKNATKYKPRSRRIIAKLYQDSGLLEEAATAFEQTAIEAGNDPIAGNLFFNAAVINEALGRDTAAVKNYEAFMAKTKKAKDRADAHYSIATIHRKNKRLTRAIEHYKEFLNYGGTEQEKNVESAYHIYELSRRVGRTTDAEEWKRKTVGMQARYAPNKKGVGASYAAKIKFLDTQETYTELRRISLRNPSKLKQNVDEKISFLTRLNKELANVIAYDSPEEVVASLYLLGQANLHMGESLTGSPVPGELKAPEEIAQYKAGVQKLADPFFAKAKESLKAAIDKGNEFETYSPEYKKAREMLGKWEPKEVYFGGERASEFKQTGWAN